MSPTLASLYPRREISLTALSEQIGARLAGPKNAGDRLVHGITTLEQAGAEHVSFVTGEKFRAQALATRAAAILVREDQAQNLERPALAVQDVWAAVIAVIEFFHPGPLPRKDEDTPNAVSPEAILGDDVSIGPLAVIEAGARIGNRVRIGAQAYIGRGAVIADDCLIHPGVTIHDGVELGRRVICHPGAVLGADGFKYEMIGGHLAKIPQLGTVVIEDDVEIGANSTIDRASFTETRVGARTKIDNLVHLAHNVVVGHDSLIIAQVGVAGSTRIGNGCVLAGQVGISDNVTIGDGIRIGAQSGVADSLTEPGDYLGSPAIPLREQARILLSLRKIPDLLRQVRSLIKDRDAKS